MVCKEEVFTWFRNLKGSKRIEAMCGFLNMCYPLELRFYGTCLEDLGRKDFYAIRDEETKANNIAEILKIRNIHDPYMRSKLIVVLSLLNSSNTACAKELFKVLSEEVKIEVMASLGILSDPTLVEHYMLLLTLAQHHPAFSFSQQTFLSNLSISLENCARELNPANKYQVEESCLSAPVFPGVGSSSAMSVGDGDAFACSSQTHRCPAPLQRRSSDSSPNSVHITNLKVKGPHKKLSIRIRVAWSNNKVIDILKTPKELLGFHQKLLDLFPTEAKTANQEKFMLSLTQCVVSAAQVNSINENIISSVYEYIQQLNTSFPGYVFENEFVTSFFMPSHPRSALTKAHRYSDCGQSDIPPRNPRLRSLTIYNSQMADTSPGHRNEPRHKPSVTRKFSDNGSSCGRASPLTSPIQSPSSSPYTSPISSETNSRAASPWSHVAGTNLDKSACNPHTDPSVTKNTVKDSLPDHWDPSKSYKIEELQAMPIEELETLGIIPDSSKGKKIMVPHSPPNGLINAFLPKSSFSAKQNLSKQQPTCNGSSPAGSEYSSPPESPTLADTCTQSDSLTSSTEENADKRNLVKAGPDPFKVDEPDSSQVIHEPSFKRTDDEAMSLKGSLNRTTISVLPFPTAYSTIMSQMPPPPNMKTAYIQLPCRMNSAPQHMSPGGMVFDNQFSRVPLPSALTYMPGAVRPHTVTPDRVLSASNIPMSTVSPFPVVTSGSATVPIATCCITTHRSNNVTVVSNSSVSSHRHMQKNPAMQGADIKPMQLTSDVTYVASGFVLTSATQLTPASCACFTTSSARPSPTPSPSMSPGATPQPSGVPVSLPYIMPYVFHQTIPFLQPQGPANGFVPQPGMGNPGQTFSYALPNGLAAIPPELIYPAQTYTLQSPSTQGASGPVNSPVSQCYGGFLQTAAVPMKIVSCYNCGKVGHRGSDCKEQTLNDLNKSGKFQLNYVPIPKIPDSHE